MIEYETAYLRLKVKVPEVIDLILMKVCMDFAFLKLTSPAQIKIPKINRSGIKPGETYFIYSLPFGPSDNPNFVGRRACIASKNSIFTPNRKLNSDALIGFTNCPIGPGNSGSPIYNSKGELVGIMAGQASPDFLKEFDDLYSILGSGQTADLRPIGWGNSFSCIPELKSNSGVTETCDLSINLAKPPSEIRDSIKTDVMKTIAEWPNSFQLHTVKGNLARGVYGKIGNILYMQIPKCLSAEVLKLGKYSYEGFTLLLEIDRDGNPTGKILSKSRKFSLEVDRIGDKFTGIAGIEPFRIPVYEGSFSLCQ